MAKRTVRRTLTQINTDTYENYEESLGYFNFAEYKGINSNKNYITIDQQSFESTKNMYVDQNGCLSLRPPLKRDSRSTGINHDEIIKIFKVNNQVFYYIRHGSYYHIWIEEGNYMFQSNFFLNPSHVINKDGLYIFFCENGIKGLIQIDGTWHALDSDQIIYKPITHIAEGGTINEGLRPNILYSGETTRYIFNSSVVTPTFDLQGKVLTVTIEDDITVEGVDNPFVKDVTFVENQEKVFTKMLYQIPGTGQHKIYVTKVGSSNVLYYLITYQFTNQSYCDLSTDGRIFTRINYPSNTCAPAIISDDGSSLYVCDLVNPKFYMLELTANEQGVVIGNWQSISYDLPAPSMNLLTAPGSSFTMLSSKYTTKMYTESDIVSTNPNVSYDRSGYAIMHSPEKGKMFALVRCNFDVITYQNSVNGYSESGASLTETRLGFIMLVFANGKVNVDLMTCENGNSWHESQIPSQGTYASFGKVRMVVGDDGYNMLILACPNVIYHTIQTDMNWKPYYSIQYLSGVAENGVHRVYQRFTNEHEQNLEGSALELLVDQSFYGGDIIAKYLQTTNTYSIKTSDATAIKTSSITNVRDSNVGNDNTYNLHYTYRSTSSDEETGERQTYPVIFDCTAVDEEFTADGSSIRISDSANYLLKNKFHYNGQDIDLIRPNDFTNVVPVYTDGLLIVYFDITNNVLYSSSFSGNITADLATDGEYIDFIPDAVANFITIAASVDNILYWSTNVTEMTKITSTISAIIPKLYFEGSFNNEDEGNSKHLPSDITALTVFSQTSLGVFLENNVYELMYNIDNNVYTLTPTKLQLGNKKGADVLPNYDGASIFITNLKGLINLTYQDFVQSTEQVYTYLTEAIMSDYDDFATAPIKLYQYKDWLFMYKLEQPNLYMFDIRNQSWWYWEFPYDILQILFDGISLNVLVKTPSGNLYLNLEYNSNDAVDMTDTPIDWYIMSQKLHFNAPNNYKHIRQLSIIMNDMPSTMRYMLMFINYHNLENLTDRDTVEFDVHQLTTIITRVNFMKTNAFQFVIARDKSDKYPTKFITPNIAIKYRITERVR